MLKIKTLRRRIRTEKEKFYDEFTSSGLLWRIILAIKNPQPAQKYIEELKHNKLYDIINARQSVIKQEFYAIDNAKLLPITDDKGNAFQNIESEKEDNPPEIILPIFSSNEKKRKNPLKTLREENLIEIKKPLRKPAIKRPFFR